MGNTNLAVEGRRLVGRADLLATARERMEESRLVTLVGPGGVGKTQVAIALAHEKVASYGAGGGGVWFCDLSEARGAGDIAGALAAVVGARVATGGTDDATVDAVGDALALRGRALVVLDAFDRLVGHARATVGRWLARAPSARFLVTSRIPLDLAGEERVPVPPLAQADAIELFQRCVRAVAPAIEPHERELAAAIVESIDRIPLAIELAARRASVLSLEQLRDRLARPLDVLDSSMRRAVLDSVELLDEDDRRLFAACSVFRNGFTLESAEAVLGDVVVPRASILDGLDALARTSLLGVTVDRGLARYSFFETIRDVAEELAVRSDVADRIAERFTAHYAMVARNGRAEGLSADFDNLLRAHEIAIARRRADEALSIARSLAPLLSVRGLGRLAVRVFEEALAAYDALDAKDAAARAEIHLALGNSYRELGESAKARAAFERGLDAASSAGDKALSAVAQTRLGEVDDVAGDTDGARSRYAAALELLATTPEDRGRAEREAEAQLRLGHALRREGSLDLARRAFLRAEERYRHVENVEGLAWTYYELAIVEMFASDEVAAFSRFDEGSRIAERGGVRVVAGALKTARGCLLQDLGRLDEALEHHAEAARVFHEVGSRYREASALYYLATTYLERREPAEAILGLRRARERLVGVGATRYEALTSGALASAHASLGDLEAAKAALEAAEDAAARVKSEPALVANVRIHRMAFEVRSGARTDFDRALDEARALVDVHPTDDSRFALRTLAAVSRAAPPPRATLLVEIGGGAFKLPDASAAVRLPARSPSRRILDALAARRTDRPGEVLTIDEVIAAGWPGEKVGSDAALNRAYVALASLRKMGLRGILLQGGGGYFLSDVVATRRCDELP